MMMFLSRCQYFIPSPLLSKINEARLAELNRGRSFFLVGKRRLAALEEEPFGQFVPIVNSSVITNVYLDRNKAGSLGGNVPHLFRAHVRHNK